MVFSSQNSENAAEINPGTVENPPEKVSEAEALDRVVQESRAKIAEADAVPVKRKRGRPRKNFPPRPDDIQDQAAPVDMAPPVSIDHRPALDLVTGMIGDQLAGQTGCDQLKFSLEERTAIAENGNVILRRLFPNSSEIPPEAVAAFAIAAVAYAKVQLYREWSAQQTAKNAGAASAA